MDFKIFKHFVILLFIQVCFLNNINAQFEENINQIFNWKEDSIVGSFAFNNAYNEIWGVEINNKEFAIIGHTDGTSIFDVTDKNNITFVDFFTSPLIGGQVVHRDYHDYNGYLYVVCDEGGNTSTLQILNISDLPNSITEVYSSNDLFTRAHNIFIDTATAKLYVCSHSTVANGFQPMAIYSLTEPTNPTLLNYYTEPGHVHDVYVRNDTAYCNNGPQGFQIIKVDDAGNYDILGSLTTYPEQGYNHSGWLTKNGKYYIMADETWGTRMKLLDVSDPTDIEVVSLFGSQTTTNSIVHNVIVEGDYVFASHYYDGLQVFNIADPQNPIRVGQFDTYLDANISSYEGAWGVYPKIENNTILISDMQTGLYVFEMELAPDANFTTTNNGNLNYTFTDASLWNATNYFWTVNGIGEGTNSNLDFTFENNTTYEVCLYATNNLGTDSICNNINTNFEVAIEDFLIEKEIKITAHKNLINFNFNLKNINNVNYKIYDLNGSLLNKQNFVENEDVNRNIKITGQNKFVIASITIENKTYSKNIWIE